MRKLKSSGKKNAGSVVTKAYRSRFMDWYGQNRFVAVGVAAAGIAVLAIVVPVAIYRSSAASGAVAFEAENGAASAQASVRTDSNASNGSYVQFSPPGSGGTNIGQDTTCKYYSVTNVQQAFCDGFNVVTPFDARYSRSGDLNGQIWGVSRVSSHIDNISWSLWGTSHIDGCGSTANVNPPHDVRICNGRLFEAINDEAVQDEMGLYPKQPFNWAGRTGTVSWDMSSDTHGGHGAWPEFWITDQPIPTPHGVIVSGQGAYIRNGVGATFRIDKCNGDPSLVSIDTISVIKNYVRQEWGFDNGSAGCIKKTKAGDAQLNHIEFKVSASTVEVWGTDPGSTTLKLLGRANNANITQTQGLVWFVDARYNAEKDDYPNCCGEPNQIIHTFAWDNLGFDGPKTYRDLAYDVPDNNIPGTGERGPGVSNGYKLGPSSPQTFTLPNVTWSQQPTSAIVTFNWAPSDSHVFPTVSVNGGPYHSGCDSPNPCPASGWPFESDGTDFFRAIAIPIPLSEVHQGSNTLSFKFTQSDIALINVNLIMVAGASVP